MLHLVMRKCMPGSLYGFNACTLTKSELSPLDFIVSRFFLMKLFKTTNIDVVKNCKSLFDSSLRARRKKKLDATYMTCDKIFAHDGY